MNPKLQGDPEGEKAVRGMLLGACLGLILWTIGVMVWWTWIS